MLQLIERVVELKKNLFLRRGGNLNLVQWHALGLFSVSEAQPAAGTVDEDMPHRLGGGAEKMSAALPTLFLSSCQPQPRLMNQGRGLQGLSGRLKGYLVSGELSEFVINKREELLGGLGIAVLKRLQDARHFAHSSSLQK